MAAHDQSVPPGQLGGPAFTIHGDATPEEVAALVAVLGHAGPKGSTQRGWEDADGIPESGSAWADHSRGVRSNPTRGPGAWRASGRPR